MSNNENERLNLLIRNLHLYLSRFKHDNEPDLYDHICQEVAEYFRADCCTIYLVSHKEEIDPESRMPKLTKWLELAGASGPWRRAFHQKYDRRYSYIRYWLPDSLESGLNTKNMLSGITRQGFWSDEPTRYASGYDIRIHRDESSDTKGDALSPVIWYRDNLYNSFRCSILAPLGHEAWRQAIARTHESTGNPSYRKIGLIKVENRSPYGVTGFSDLAPSDGYLHLFFHEEWKITALRPFVNDLHEKAAHDPFYPIHNNLRWQRYFDNHSSGAVYFQELVRGLGQRYKPDDGALKKQLHENYEKLADWLMKLLECIIRLESWVQHLRYACTIICGVREKSDYHKLVPSLFNVYNLTTAQLICWFEGAITINDLSESHSHGVDIVCEQLLNCLTDKREEDRRILNDLKTKLLILLKGLYLVEKLVAEFKEEPAKLGKEKIRPVIEFFSDVQHYRLLICEPKSRYGTFCEKMKLDLQNLSDAANDLFQNLIILHQSIELFYDSLAQEIKDCIERLCLQYVEKIRLCLWNGPEIPFQISKCLDGELPNKNDDFIGALKIVEEDLMCICKSFENVKLRKPEKVDMKDRESREELYKLITEETEVRYIQKTLLSILEMNHPLEKYYGVACDLDLKENNDSHLKHANELDEFGCQMARALATATMNADSFNQIDEKRLAFVANLITQVLDNYFLHQVYQRRLEMDHRALDLLGMEQFSLELLDAFNSYAQRLMNTLIYLVKREAFCICKNDLPVECHPLKLKDFFDSIYVQESVTKKQWIQCSLIEVSFLFMQDIGTSVLQKIGAFLTNKPEQNNLTGDFNNKAGLELKLKNIIPNNDKLLAYCELQCNALSMDDRSKNDNTYHIQLFLKIESKAVQVRDVRAFWSGVKTLMEVVKVIEIMAGKEDYPICR